MALFMALLVFAILIFPASAFGWCVYRASKNPRRPVRVEPMPRTIKAKYAGELTGKDFQAAQSRNFC
jgi:hypothetical protein